MAAVREHRQLGPHHALGEALQLVHVDVGVRSVPIDQPDQPALADAARGELSPEVAEYVHRLTGVGLDQAKQHRVLDAGVDQLRERDPEALLVDLGGVDGDAAGRDAADVGVMSHRRRIPHERVAAGAERPGAR